MKKSRLVLAAAALMLGLGLTFVGGPVTSSPSEGASSKKETKYQQCRRLCDKTWMRDPNLRNAAQCYAQWGCS
jgi:hypothetical protein